MPPKKSTVVSASITDFFPRRVSSQPSSSQTAPSIAPTKQRLPPRPDQEVISVSSASHISVSSGTRSIITVSDSTRSFINPDASYDPMESISSRGVARQYHVAPPKPSPGKQSTKHSTASKTSFKRKAIADSDSEVESIDAVAYISRSPVRTRTSAQVVAAPLKPITFSDKENLTHQLSQPSPVRKKPRRSSPEPRPLTPDPPIAPSDAGELVPSSQSDEQDEMVLNGPPRDPVAIMEDVDRWRNEARSPLSLPMSERAMSEPEDMDLDVVPDDLVTVAEASPAAFTPEPSPEPQQRSVLLTPHQHRSQPSLPVTPIALTEASKTAKIIADIKAQALATALSSPDDSPLGPLKELSDSDDDEDLIAGVTLDPFSSSPLSSAPTAARYSLRDRGTSDRSASRVASTSRKSPSPSRRSSRAPPPPRAQPLKKVVSDDPLAALLREKKRDDKSGKGGAALRQAEDAMRASSPLSDESDGEVEDWTNEAAALAAVKAHGRAWGTSSPGAGVSDGEEMVLNEEDQLRLLGEKRGKAVVGILDSDRAKREVAKGKQKVLGVPLWEVGAAPMDTDIALPSLDHIRGQPVLSLLKSSIDSGDLTQAALLLSSGIFATLNLLEHQASILCLCDLALSPRATILTIPAFNALLHMWQRPSGSAPSMSFDAPLSLLVRLGAQASVLRAMGWVVRPGLHCQLIQPTEREDVLYRLVRLVTISTQSAPPALSELSDFVMALFVVGMDPSSSPDHQREIMVAVDLLCKSVAPNADISAETETTICNKLIKFVSDFQPINKAHLVALLARGSGRTARIAQWVAYAVITKSDAISVAQYNKLPPLTILIDRALSQELEETRSEGQARGIFEVYDGADYDDLEFYVQILAVATSNVPGYVQEEASQPVIVTPASPGKPSAEKPDTKLTLVRNAIENLHSRIVDTRAAHLDRSRAKGALKRLSMRLYYQQEVALKSRRGKKLSRPIQQYFRSQPSTSQ
ncbi:hypothetical protein B0H16DRAFT_486848 [Mycena metata]|uniref:Uncharacterized protein n=1 Tax=Mycena metata TaxID=1033252 RepID=A0AAD7P0Z1_9AGAR|nr:hypothetical protein B0H16DRAFT_486848 [Mycena metata]